MAGKERRDAVVRLLYTQKPEHKDRWDDELADERLNGMFGLPMLDDFPLLFFLDPGFRRDGKVHFEVASHHIIFQTSCISVKQKVVHQFWLQVLLLYLSLSVVHDFIARLRVVSGPSLFCSALLDSTLVHCLSFLFCPFWSGPPTYNPYSNSTQIHQLFSFFYLRRHKISPVDVTIN